MILQTVTLPKFITKVVLSEKRRPKYYEKGKGGKPIPKKYLTPEYNWVNFPYRSKEGKKDRYYWANIKTSEPVVSNPKAAGTSKYIAVNTQLIYQGLDEYTRSKLMKGIKRYYLPYLEKIKALNQFPIEIEYLFYTTIEKDYDIDNMSWLYLKAFHDLLTALEIIPKDTARIIRKYSPEIVEIEDFEDRKLVINIKPYKLRPDDSKFVL